MLEGVTIEQLRTLLAVAEAGSFSAAAKKLGRVQGAVSQAIDRLETQLGLRLFDRSGRVPRLTRQGRAVVDAAAKIGRDLDSLGALTETLKGGRETRLTVVADVMVPTASLVAFARALAKAHPDIELVLVTDVLSAVTAHVRDKRATWGIAVEDASFEDLERRRIADIELLPVAAKSHPLARRAKAGERLDAAALADVVQIVHGAPDGGEDGADRGRDHGVFSGRTWRVADLATKHALITAGLGWGHMPEHLVREDLEQKRLVLLELEAWGASPPKRSLLLCWRRGAVMGPVARWAEARFAELCVREVEPHTT
jgi:DNA-binding transcriptional LysR family regulator